MSREPHKFKVGDYEFIASPINAKAQLPIFTKTSPLLAAGAVEFLQLTADLRKGGVKNIADAGIERLAQLMTPVMRELAKLPPDEMWGILSSLLAPVEILREGRWVKFWNSAAGLPVFQDEFNDDLFLLVRIALNVYMGTFKSFFPAGLSDFFGGAAAP